jgi:hypothetical protein
MGRLNRSPLHILSFSCVIVVTVHNAFIVAQEYTAESPPCERRTIVSFHLLNVCDRGPLSPAVTDDEDKGAYLPPLPDIEGFILMVYASEQGEAQLLSCYARWRCSQSPYGFMWPHACWGRCGEKPSL